MQLFSISLGPLLLLSYLQILLIVSSNCQLTQVSSLQGDETDRLGLLHFKQSVTSDPHGILNSWNDSIHFCSWFGVNCSQNSKRVSSLSLAGQELSGTISPHIGNLSFLRKIILNDNSFYGTIPREVGKLSFLKHLFLNNNSLAGEIPVNLSLCYRLRTIDLGWNNVGGQIPTEVGCLKRLRVLNLPENRLTGRIPPSLGNLSSLQILVVAQNSLVGEIPGEMDLLQNLTMFTVASNGLSGSIPPSLFNISSIEDLSLTRNMINGSLPEKAGINLRNLKVLRLGDNQISGTIPSSLANASQLQLLDIAINYFEGEVPSNLGELPSLYWLNLGMNYLGGNSTDDLVFLKSLEQCRNLETLDISFNFFNGMLPTSLANFSTSLSMLMAGSNQIFGSISPALENLTSLIALGLENNIFTGAIPSYIGKLQNVQHLYLNRNRLSGRIPSSLGNLSQLSLLSLSGNSLEGTIPPSIGNCQKLNVFDAQHNNLTGDVPREILMLPSLSQFLGLSNNNFSGSLPQAVGKLKALNQLNVSDNNLSGKIPSTIGDCSSLESLFLQRNSFQGAIPESVASLKGLQYLDLSRNNLSGEIPKAIQNLTCLLYLNISFNDLEGEVPTGGVFANASAIYLMGNNRLCGGIPQLHLPKCNRAVSNKKNAIALKPPMLIALVVLCSLLMVCLSFFYTKKRSKLESSASTFPGEHFIKVSYKSLYEATGGFSSENLLGSGSFGSVYKGFLNQVGKLVAIKVLNLQQKGSSKSILSECNTLKNIRHRNLVGLITYCSTLDNKGKEFKALVYELMPNGSLDNWLHPHSSTENRPRSLDILQRLNIAIDVALALHYLHDLCEVPIIHRDLKPSNVLIDNDMVAHVGDFGLARFLPTLQDSSQSATTTGLLGTIGYAAPEYGLGAASSKEGDVYSYGTLVLEMFSGRRPTDEMFKDGMNLCNFTKEALPRGLMQIVDPTLFRTDPNEAEATATTSASAGEEQEDGDNEEIQMANYGGAIILKEMKPYEKHCLLSIFEIGVSCSQESPKERTNIADILRELHLVKDAYLGAQVQRGSRPHTVPARRSM